jgi:tetratricopeptide (TPR) repeat protein
MGLAHLNKRDYPNAIAELARAIALNPALPSAQVLYGRALLGAGDRDHAMRVFRTALEQEPTNFDANLQLGTLYRIEQRFDDAMLYLRRAASVKPDDVGLRHSMAATQLGLGDVEKARELLEGVTKDAPGFVDAHVLLATAYYRLKRKDEGDRERAIIERLTAEKQASQPGAKREEVERGSGSDDPGSPPRPPKS